jgi:hypothetical protein
VDVYLYAKKVRGKEREKKRKKEREKERKRERERVVPTHFPPPLLAA